jgi:SPX domain protein involved in polyphosphate accumulation
MSMFTEFSKVLQLSQIDPSILEGFEPSIDRMLRFPAVRAWWSRQPFTFPQDSLIRRHIDSRPRELHSETAAP